MRTFDLTERQTAEVALTDDDLDFLLACHGRHLRIVPTRTRDIFRVTPTRLVGTIRAPSCRLVLRPKLPLSSLAFLLDPDAPPTPGPGEELLAQEGGIREFLALRLTQLVRECAAAGLHVSYVERTSEGSVLHGRLDLKAQLRDLPRRDVLHGRQDDLTADVLCNQVPRAILKRLTPETEVGRRAVGEALALLEGVSDVTPTAEDMVRLTAADIPARYRPLLEMCRLLFAGLQTSSGPAGPETAFLLDLQHLFERWVTRAVRDAFAGDGRIGVSAQPLFRFPPASLRPDVVVRDGEQVRIVVDAKWKRLRTTVRPDDFHQALAYASALGSPHVELVFPGRRDTCRIIPLPDDGPQVVIRTLCVTRGAEGCRRAAERFGRALRACCV